MNKDIFGNIVEPGSQVITSDFVKGVLSVGGDTWVGILIQNFSVTYSQQSQPIYELGSGRKYRVKGRPEGQMTIGRIIGLNNALPVEEALFDTCSSGGSMTIHASNGKCNNTRGSFTLVLGGINPVGYQFQSTAGQLISSENLSFTIDYLARKAT